MTRVAAAPGWESPAPTEATPDGWMHQEVSRAPRVDWPPQVKGQACGDGGQEADPSGSLVCTQDPFPRGGGSQGGNCVSDPES